MTFETELEKRKVNNQKKNRKNSRANAVKCAMHRQKIKNKKQHTKMD